MEARLGDREARQSNCSSSSEVAFFTVSYYHSFHSYSPNGTRSLPWSISKPQLSTWQTHQFLSTPASLSLRYPHEVQRWTSLTCRRWTETHSCWLVMLLSESTVMNWHKKVSNSFYFFFHSTFLDEPRRTIEGMLLAGVADLIAVREQLAMQCIDIEDLSIRVWL